MSRVGSRLTIFSSVNCHLMMGDNVFMFIDLRKLVFFIQSSCCQLCKGVQ